MKVKRNTLLLLAALVWGIAGANILRIGLAAYPAYLTLWNTLLSVLVFAVFQQAVFGKLVKKHTARIGAYPDERLFFLRFFDRKSFVIMAVMMTESVCGPAVWRRKHSSPFSIPVWALPCCWLDCGSVKITAELFQRLSETLSYQ